MTQSQRYPKPHHKHHVLRYDYSSPTMPDEHSYHALTEISQEALDFLSDLQLEATPPGPRQHDALGPLPQVLGHDLAQYG